MTRRHGPVYPELAGRTAVVTGAGRGLGEAHTLALLSNGVNVVAGDIDLKLVTATAKRLNEANSGSGRVIPAAIDVASHEDHQALASLALTEFGRLDAWVNNAGIFPGDGVLDISPTQMKRTMDINVNGALYGTQAAAAAMGDKGGVIVNMSSIAALSVRAGYAAYGASKAAVDHLTRFLAVELGPKGFRVNAIAPGIIRTEMTTWVHQNPEVLATALETIPLRRLGEPHDVSQAMLFLVSDSSSFVNGHTLVVDGGGRHR